MFFLLTRSLALANRSGKVPSSSWTVALSLLLSDH